MTEQQLTLFGLKQIASLAQGQGAATERKERGLMHAFAVNLKIQESAPGARRFAYWHVDLHCGAGMNEKAGCIGSPLAFLAVANLYRPRNYHAFLADREPAYIKALYEHEAVAADPRCYLFNGENREVLQVFAQSIRDSGENPRYTMGSVLCDPNGYLLNPQTVPLNELAAFCREFPRIDLVLNMNVRSLRMERAHVAKGAGAWGKRRWLELDDLPVFFHRQHWLILERNKGQSRFVLMVGRNLRVSKSKTLGFYHLDSPEGQRIVEKTKRSCDSDPTLNTSAIQSSWLLDDWR